MAQVKEQGLVSFLALSKPKIPFLGLSLLRNQKETLATQATQAIQQSACHTTYFLEMGDSGNYGKPNWLTTNKALFRIVLSPLYYYMNNFSNLIGLEQWYFSVI